jgi:CHASE3 domain sensor protein
MRDHEQRSEVKHAALDERITHVAEAALPVQVYSSDQRARDAEVRALQEEFRQLRAEMRQERRDREAEDAERERERARDKRLVLAAFVSPLVLLLVQVWLSSKGAA